MGVISEGNAFFLDFLNISFVNGSNQSEQTDQ